MKQLFVVLLAFFVLSSCGKNVTVNLAEAALLWRIDDYFDINRNQRKEIKAQFRQGLKSINSEYIPEFEKVIFADELVTKSCNDVEVSYYKLKPRFELMRTSFLKHSYSFLDSIESDQVEHFIDYTQEQIAKDERKTKSAKINSTEKRLERTEKTLEELFGVLSAQQKQSLRQHVLNRKSEEELVLQSRRKNLALLQTKSIPEAKDFFKNFVIDWRSFQTPDLKAAMLDREAYNEKFYLNFFCTATTKQKKHFQTTVSDYLNLFRQVYIAGR